MRNGNVEYTSVDELIAALQKVSDDGYGDYPVCVNGASPIMSKCLGRRPWYYDGGYIVRDATKGPYDYVRSRQRGDNGRTKMHPDVKDACIDLEICDPCVDDEATIDGRTVRDMQPETWEFLDQDEQKELAIFGGLVQYRLSTTKDQKTGFYPVTAYLDSGESAVGANRHEARENLKKKIQSE